MAALCFEDVEIGADILRIVTGPMSTAHIVRWSASMENWHRIHYDWRYATAHDGPPDVMVNGSWKQHVMLQLLTDWVGESGWPWKLSFQFRGMNVPGDTLSAWGRVTGRERRAAAAQRRAGCRICSIRPCSKRGPAHDGDRTACAGSRAGCRAACRRVRDRMVGMRCRPRSARVCSQTSMHAC